MCMELEQYKNLDGTYTSPRNGKTYKSLKAFKAHWHHSGLVNLDNFAKRLQTIACRHCHELISIGNHKKHEEACYLNPTNLRRCEVCDGPIKDYKKSKGTCSHSCSNKFFSTLRNKPENYSRYTTLCWKAHKKECVVCGENKIVAVHHMNEDHEDNRVENLVPLCPTHHSYMHSKYKDEILPIVNKYIEKFSLRFA